MQWLRKLAVPVLAGLILCFGLLAMVNGIQSRSLLLDEALFVRNVTKFPAGYFISMAPSAPLFYTLSYILMSLVGKSEWVFRLIPLVCAVAGVVLLSVHLGRHFSRLVSLVSMFLLAFSVPLVYYASNAHPYTADFLCSAALLILTSRLTQAFDNRTWIVWLAASFVAVVSSFSSFFVILSCSAVLLSIEIGQTDRRVLRMKAVGLAGLAAYMLLLVVLVFSKQAADHSEYQYWFDCFPPSRNPFALAKFTYFKTEQALGFLFFNDRNGLIGLFLSLLGTFYWVRRKKSSIALLCWLPVVFTVLASFVQKWPYGPLRTVLFLLPFFLVLMAAGMELIWRTATGTPSRTILVAAFCLLLLPQSWMAKKAFVPAGDSEEAIKSLSTAMRPEIKNGDGFLVYYAAEVQFRFYFPQYINRAVFQPWSDRGNRSALEAFVEKQAKGQQDRFWLVFSHTSESEDRIMASAAEKFGRRVSSHAFQGCSAVLFEKGNGPPVP